MITTLDEAIKSMYQRAHEAKTKASELAKNAQPDEAFKCLEQAEYWIQIADWLTELQGYKETEIPQDECIDISKLRLMTLEECESHTANFAMGWKACIEWIKRGCDKE